MKTIVTPLALAASLLLATGCISFQAPFKPPQGVLFTSVKAPLDIAPGGSPVRQSKGVTKSLYVHDPIFTGMSFAWQDCSIAAAARAGGLSRVEYADYDMLAILGVFGRMQVTAYGPAAQ